MDKSSKQKLETLRKRVPIGLRYGLDLIRKNNGNIQKAEKQFKTDMASLLVSKTGIDMEIALTHLNKSNFDFNKALISVNEERFTLTELILKKNRKDKEGILGTLMEAIEENYNLKREFWLDLDDLKRLPNEISSFMTIMEWLNYESWEDFVSALTFNLAIFNELIEKNLDLKDLSELLRKADVIRKSIFIQYNSIDDLSEIWQELQKNNEFSQCEIEFSNQRPLLVERLYEFVTNNLDKFP